MAEFENNHTHSSGVAKAGLTTGIIGTALGGLMALGSGAGLLGGINGITRGNTGNVEDEYVTRYDADKDAQISRLEQEIALGKSEKYTDQKIIDVFERITTRIANDEQNFNAQMQTQAVYNATNTANINCMANQIAQLQSMTKLYIPSTNVTPQPMNLYNSWTAPTEG